MTVYMKYIMSKTLKSSQPRRASWDRLRILELLIDSNDRRFDEKLVVDAHSADHQEKADHVKSVEDLPADNEREEPDKQGPDRVHDEAGV